MPGLRATILASGSPAALVELQWPRLIGVAGLFPTAGSIAEQSGQRAHGQAGENKVGKDVRLLSDEVNAVSLVFGTDALKNIRICRRS